MYLDRAIEEDNKMVESWKGDADGMLVFVGHQTTSHVFAYDVQIVDWSILRCGRGIARSFNPEYCAKPAKRLPFLSCTHLSATERDARPHPVEHTRPHREIRSAYVGRLGQRTLVLESGRQSDLCPIIDIATAVGASLSKGCLSTLQAPQASTHSSIL